MDLTKEQAIEWHRKMWNWIAANEGIKFTMSERMMLKGEYLKLNGFKDREILNDCFCCEYAKKRTIQEYGFYNPAALCKYCPLKFDVNCEYLDKFDWRYGNAKLIAELEENPNV